MDFFSGPWGISWISALWSENKWTELNPKENQNKRNSDENVITWTNGHIKQRELIFFFFQNKNINSLRFTFHFLCSFETKKVGICFCVWLAEITFSMVFVLPIKRNQSISNGIYKTDDMKLDDTIELIRFDRTELEMSQRGSVGLIFFFGFFFQKQEWGYHHHHLLLFYCSSSSR